MSQPIPVSEPLPQRPGFWELLTAYNTPGPRIPGALRAALAVALPGAIALAMGLDNLSLLIAGGGCAVIYGEGHAYRKRWRVILTAAVLITTCAMGGAFVGSVVWGEIAAGGHHLWLLLVVVYIALLASISTFVQNALRLPPPGAFFIVMVAGGSTMAAQVGINPLTVGTSTLIGGLSGLVIGMMPALSHYRLPQQRAVEALEKTVDEVVASPTAAGVAKTHQAELALASAWSALHDAGSVRGGRPVPGRDEDLVDRVVAAHQRLLYASPHIDTEGLDDAAPQLLDATRSAIPHSTPSVQYLLFRSVGTYSHATMSAARVLGASVLAGVLGVVLGFDRPDWAIVSAMLVLQWGPDRLPGTIRGLHRLIGSVLGVAVFAVFHYFQLDGYGQLLALAACQFFAEYFVVRNYALTVVATTPLALLMGNALSRPLGPTVTSRLIEILIATVFAILVLWIWIPNAEARHHTRTVNRAFSAMGGLLGQLMTSTPLNSLPERRDLQFELLSERRAAQSLANNAPAQAEKEWTDHLKLQRAGYAILDYCTANNDRELTLEEINALATRVREAYPTKRRG